MVVKTIGRVGTGGDRAIGVWVDTDGDGGIGVLVDKYGDGG